MTGGAAATGRRLRTVGVEEELLLVDALTMHPTPAAGRILERSAATTPAHSTLEPVLEFEVKHEQIEVVSPPRETAQELLATILEGRRHADAAARAVGARAVALGTGTLPCDPHLVAAPRYLRMREGFGLTLDEQLTCGFHVHVAVESDHEGVGVLDRIRPWLPVLLALSANSPFWRGTDTGFASYRYQAWNRWPSAGCYDLFDSPEGYRARMAAILETEVSFDTGMLYFDARLSQHAPTVETRIADVCLRPADAAVLAVLIRALVDTAAADWKAGVPADPVPTALLRLASWRASKSGLGDSLLHPGTSRPVPAASAVAALLEHVHAHFADPDEARLVRDGVEEILRRGSGAAQQRAVMAERKECCEVVAAAAEQTIAG
jgi:carboxylate-amine ligase